MKLQFQKSVAACQLNKYMWKYRNIFVFWEEQASFVL